jgi:hypothetical protein
MIASWENQCDYLDIPVSHDDYGHNHLDLVAKK